MKVSLLLVILLFIGLGCGKGTVNKEENVGTLVKIEPSHGFWNSDYFTVTTTERIFYLRGRGSFPNKAKIGGKCQIVHYSGTCGEWLKMEGCSRSYIIH